MEENQPVERHTAEPESPKLRWIILAIAAIVALLAIASAGIISSNKDSNESVDSVFQAQGFANPLQPASEITIGSGHYVSPCQALPLESATTIFGASNDTTFVTEDALTVSVPASTNETSYKTSCSYKLADSKVSLRADQYSDASAKKEPTHLFPGTIANYQKLIAEFKEVASGSNNQDAKDLVTNMEKSLQTYQKSQANYDGIILPKLFGTGFAMLRGDALYTLSYEPASSQDPNKSAEALGKINQGLKLVAKNAANSKLDQAPINPILGKSDKIGSTKILEPCVLLSTSTYKAITGVTENDVVNRQTMPLNPSRDIIDKKVNKRVLFANSCTRHTDGGDTDVSAELQLYQAKTIAYAQQYVKDFYDDPTEPAPTPLQTSADEAFVYANSLDPSTVTYLFRVGPYVGIVRLETTDSSGSDLAIKQSGQAEHISAINLLTTRIKAQQ